MLFLNPTVFLHIISVFGDISHFPADWKIFAVQEQLSLIPWFPFVDVSSQLLPNCLCAHSPLRAVYSRAGK